MNIELPPCALTAETVAAYRLSQTDQDLVRAATAAAIALTQSLARLDATALLRRASAMPAGHQWLLDLTQTAHAMHGTLLAERAESEAVYKADGAQRHRLDSTAMDLYQRIANEAQGHKAASEQKEAATLQMRASLKEAGLSDAEIARTLAARAAGEASRADDRRTALIDCQLRQAALEAYLRDPLRRLDVLSPELQAELLELHDALASRAGDVDSAIRQASASRLAQAQVQPIAGA